VGSRDTVTVSVSWDHPTAERAMEACPDMVVEWAKTIRKSVAPTVAPRKG
jgi:hypothetical protein